MQEKYFRWKNIDKKKEIRTNNSDIKDQKLASPFLWRFWRE